MIAAPRGDGAPALGRTSRPLDEVIQRSAQQEAALAPLVPNCDRLLDRLDTCLRFAIRTVTNADRAHHCWTVDLGQVSGYEKMMLEAGVLALVTGRSGHCASSVRQLLSSLRTAYDSNDTLCVLMRQPSSVTTLGTTLLVFQHFGLTDDRERSVLTAALESPFRECNERIPFRLLDRRWVLGVAQDAGLVIANGAIDTAALELSVACRTTHPIYMTREDAYALTHAVMYSTDFGRREPPQGMVSEALSNTIDACLAWCLAAGDFDLVAELLLSQLHLKGSLTEYGAVAWQVASRAWDKLGFLPSPSISAEEFERIVEEQHRKQYAYYHMYHTIFVAGLLCCSLLDTGTTIAQTPSHHQIDPKISTAVRRTIDRAVQYTGCHLRELREPQWIGDSSRVDDLVQTWGDVSADRAAVLRMAIDAFTIERARESDLGGLAAALMRSFAAPRVSPTDCAAVAFVADHGLPNGAIGAAFLDESLSECEEARSVTAALASILLLLDDRIFGNFTEASGAH